MVAPHLERTVYLNGEFLPGKEANISIFDRGLLFADAVYEGLGVRNGRIIDFDNHMKRLRRSLGELAIPEPKSEVEFAAILQKLISINGMEEGFLYLHITRGTGDRDYLHSEELKPTVFAFTQPGKDNSEKMDTIGVTMISHLDLRWKRRDIKTSNLLGQVIAKNAADRAGGYEALMVDDEGFVTEGGATSFFMIKGRKIFARPVTNEILHGITRQAMLKVAGEEEMEVTEQVYSLQDAYDADEAFITGASSYIQPVVRIDDRDIGDGKPGEITLKLRAAYLAKT
ncbi:MAG: D-amino acid aminotransferase [Pseudomonadota bacterium]